jgi:hypothetical protein
VRQIEVITPAEYRAIKRPWALKPPRRNCPDAIKVVALKQED